MTMSGMDVSAIRDVARQLSHQSESVAEAMRAVDSLLEVARHHWQGQDLQQFDATWVDQYRGICLRLGANLADLSRVAGENAEAQERVSASLNGGSGHPSWGNGAPQAPYRPDARMSPSSTPLPGLLEGMMDGAQTMDTIEKILTLPAGMTWDDINASPLISSLAFLPDAVDAFADASTGDLSQGEFVDFYGKTLGVGGDLMDSFATSAWGARLGTAFGAVAGGISSGMDFGQAMEDYKAGNPWAGTYNLLHGSATAVGTVVKPVGWCTTAWDAGVGIGTAIGNSEPAQKMQDNAVAYGAANDGDIATRYDVGKRGLSAIGNFFGDSLMGNL